jgi:hypothetical protein
MRVRSIGLTLALCVVGVAVGLAASAQMGTWKLDEAKSKLPGKARNSMVVYAPAGDSVKITIDGIDATGKAVHSEWTGKFDGKDYAVTGDATSHMRSYKVVNPHTLSFKATLAGKPALSGLIVVSAGGNSRTVKATRTDADGKTTTFVSAYDRQ